MTETTQRSLAHAGFTLVRDYPVSVENVWAAFAEEDQKKQWFGDGDEWNLDEWRYDFRVGGHDISRHELRLQGDHIIEGDSPGTVLFQHKVSIDHRQVKR